MAQKIGFSTATQTTNSQTSHVTLSPLDEKLRRNFYEKALRESGNTAKTPTAFDLPPPSNPLQLQVDSAKNQGKRKEMEDAHFHCKIPEGFMMGIFDGHGENGVIATRAAKTYELSFPTLLRTHPEDKKKIFKTINTSFHESLSETTGGTTALFCFFDSLTHRLYTSNLGDSKALVFRKTTEGLIDSFPVSIERNWANPKDMERARIAFNDPEFFKIWSQAKNPKERRFPFPFYGVNVSRSLGDKGMTINDKTATSQNAHQTFVQLKEGDLLVMGCDGVWDFVTPEGLIDNVLTANWDHPFLAQRIVNYALKTSSDNITVICARTKATLSASSSLESTQSFEDSESSTD